MPSKYTMQMLQCSVRIHYNTHPYNILHGIDVIQNVLFSGSIFFPSLIKSEHFILTSLDYSDPPSHRFGGPPR